MLEEIEKRKRKQPTALTVGVFDGVHLGHRHLINILKGRAREMGAIASIITFDRHPYEVICPGSPFPYLTTKEQRLKLLEELGVEVIVLQFTQELRMLSPIEFLKPLVELINMKLMVMGPDFRLGRDRSGDLHVIGLIGRELGFDIEVVPFYRVEGEIVSSTLIREALLKGQMERATRFLGRPFTILGKAIPGHGVGGVLGFPTANLSPPKEQILPANGVYAGWAKVGEMTFPSAIYIGNRPTFSGRERVIEAHLLGDVGKIYGHMITLQIISRIRDEMVFSSPQELRGQIERDIIEARRVLGV